MKASELRPGNFVLKQDQVIEVTPEILISFWEKDSDLSPIPIDEQWLKRFGFEEIKYADSKSKWFSDDVLELELKRNGCFIFKTFEIAYVHQFQNVYLDLTGDELVCDEYSH